MNSINTQLSIQAPSDGSSEALFGQRIRDLRNKEGLSLKRTAELSGLNINTLSLIENGKTSPSVSTLQQLAKALDVPISAFFESEPKELHVVYTKRAKRPNSMFGQTQMENLGKDLCCNVVQPFVVTIEPGSGSGDQAIVHTGHEFVFCLSGEVIYTVDKIDYVLETGDSLVFEAHLPHFWTNRSQEVSQLILVIYPVDQREEPAGRHFVKPMEKL
jgi:transcriptional regulator with XRE-family HTH domain